MSEPNRYSVSEIIEYLAVRGPDNVWYPNAYAVIGTRKCINGQEVEDDGTPKRQERMAPGA